MEKENLEKETRKVLYERMDSFLVEGDKPREIGQLNLDRHLFVDTTTALILEIFEKEKQKQLQELREKIEKMKKRVLPIANDNVIDTAKEYVKIFNQAINEILELLK